MERKTHWGKAGIKTHETTKAKYTYGKDSGVKTKKETNPKCKKITIEKPDGIT